MDHIRGWWVRIAARITGCGPQERRLRAAVAGRTVLVTGAAEEIGPATARRLAAAGDTGLLVGVVVGRVRTAMTVRFRPLITMTKSGWCMSTPDHHRTSTGVGLGANPLTDVAPLLMMPSGGWPPVEAEPTGTDRNPADDVSAG